MASSNDGSQANHNVFLGRPRTLEKPGITPVFIHAEIIDPLQKLIEKLGKAASIKPDFMGTKNALVTLRGTVSSIGGVLGEPNATPDDNVDEEQQSFRL